MGEVLIRFTVPGKPIPKARALPRRGKGRSYTPQKTIEYEAKVRAAAALIWGDREPHDGKVAITCTFRGHAWNADGDNLYKTISDAIEGERDGDTSVLTNDRNVVDGHFYLRPLDEFGARAEVLITIINPEDIT